MNGLIIGTAGHIDHGKTSLVQALTGTDTDRLAEEKRRGISIDLGFAHLHLPNGKMASFIDVPGHERFVKNMLAGAGGIEAVLLVVAADDSVRPQTREHFHICRLLGIGHGVVAMTKADIATVEQRENTMRDVRELCAHSFMENASMIAVSTVTGQGLSELREELLRLSETVRPRDTQGLARLPIDRSFALHGFGTVVTGTLWSGRLRTSDVVELLPTKQQARIRGLQVHGQSVSEATAGQRTAVNLAGIEHGAIQRGQVLVHPGTLAANNILEVSLDWIPEFQTTKKREEVLLHLGTAEIPGILKTLHPGIDGESALGRIELRQPVVALPGDRFVLRRPSPAHTIAGGSVIDPFPALRINRLRTLSRLDKLRNADMARRVRLLVEDGKYGSCLTNLVRATGLPAERARQIVESDPELLLFRHGEAIVTRTWLQEKRTRLFTWLTAFHAKHPELTGASLAASRLGLPLELSSIVMAGFAPVTVRGETIALASHQARWSSGQIQMLAKLEAAFKNGGFQPPLPNEALIAAGGDPQQHRSLLESLVKGKRLVRVAPGVIFHCEVMAQIRAAVTQHRGRTFSVPEFKEWMSISRKYAIPLLEYLDRERVTRRVGDARVVL